MNIDQTIVNMRPVSKRVKKILERDPFMKKCCIPDCNSSEVEWEHSWIYSGKQVDEWWAIMPMCQPHHRGKLKTAETKKWGQLISLMRAGNEPYIKYPKKDWAQEKRRLEYDLIKKGL